MSSTKRSILSEPASATGSEKNSTSERSASRFLPASRAEMAVTTILRPVREASAWRCRLRSRATAAPTVPTPATPTRRISLISFFRKSKQRAGARRGEWRGSARFSSRDQGRGGDYQGAAKKLGEVDCSDLPHPQKASQELSRILALRAPERRVSNPHPEGARRACLEG